MIMRDGEVSGTGAVSEAGVDCRDSYPAASHRNKSFADFQLLLHRNRSGARLL